MRLAVHSIFKMADKDGSGAVDWSEFANLLVTNVSKN
jgi:Ca2+-binding EF-hand superfamily protein